MLKCVKCGADFEQVGAGRRRTRCYSCAPARQGQDWRKYRGSDAVIPTQTGDGVVALDTDDSNVPRIAWDGETHDLTVTFASGNTYRFDGVAKRFFTELQGSGDLSRFVRKHLMTRFDYERVD